MATANNAAPKAPPASDDSTGLKTQQSFKEQLDRAAFEAKFPDAGKPEATIVDKVVEYVPPLGKLLGKNNTPDESARESPVAPDVAPRRPDHDPNIEEFVRDQHRSKQPDGKIVT